MSALVTNSTQSCGCLLKEITSERTTKDLTGQRFSHLLVLHRTEDHITSGGNVHHMYKCRCDCGVERNFQAGLLRTGHVKSCGCMTGNVTSPKGNQQPKAVPIRQKALYSADITTECKALFLPICIQDSDSVSTARLISGYSFLIGESEKRCGAFQFVSRLWAPLKTPVQTIKKVV